MIKLREVCEKLAAGILLQLLKIVLEQRVVFSNVIFLFKVINLHIPNKFKYLTKITTNFLSASIIKQYINFLKKKIHVVCM